jgi:glycosyltransferase involved in cell wall biosynthesis
LGKPVIAFGEGGALETVIDGKTGLFFNEQETESLIDALNRFNNKSWDGETCRNNAEGFSKNNFVTSFKQNVASLM